MGVILWEYQRTDQARTAESTLGIDEAERQNAKMFRGLRPFDVVAGSISFDKKREKRNALHKRN